jgi:hypothetical protein
MRDDMLLTYDSIPDYLNKIKPVTRLSANSEGSKWDKEVSPIEAWDLAMKGDLSVVSRATGAVDKLNANTVAMSPRAAFLPDFAGSRVSVPRYLGGVPTAMMRRQKAELANPHVSIYVGIVCSAALSAEQMLTRGTTILSLLESLTARKMSVDLFLFAEMHGSKDGWLYQVIKVDSRPLDLSSAGFAIAHPAFARNVTYKFAEQNHGFNGGWPRGYDMYQGENPDSPYYQEFRKRVGLDPLDIIIPSPHCADESMTKPDTWLEKKMDLILKNARAE